MNDCNREGMPRGCIARLRSTTSNHYDSMKKLITLSFVAMAALSLGACKSKCCKKACDAGCKAACCASAYGK